MRPLSVLGPIVLFGLSALLKVLPLSDGATPVTADARTFGEAACGGRSISLP